MDIIRRIYSRMVNIFILIIRVSSRYICRYFIDNEIACTNGSICLSVYEYINYIS